MEYLPSQEGLKLSETFSPLTGHTLEGNPRDFLKVFSVLIQVEGRLKNFVECHCCRLLLFCTRCVPSAVVSSTTASTSSATTLWVGKKGLFHHVLCCGFGLIEYPLLSVLMLMTTHARLLSVWLKTLLFSTCFHS